MAPPCLSCSSDLGRQVESNCSEFSREQGREGERRELARTFWKPTQWSLSHPRKDEHRLSGNPGARWRRDRPGASQKWTYQNSCRETGSRWQGAEKVPRPPSGERIMSAQGPWGSHTPVYKQRRRTPYLTPYKPCSRPMANPKARTKARKPLKTLKRDVVIVAERMTRLNR